MLSVLRYLLSGILVKRHTRNILQLNCSITKKKIVIQEIVVTSRNHVYTCTTNTKALSISTACRRNTNRYQGNRLPKCSMKRNRPSLLIMYAIMQCTRIKTRPTLSNIAIVGSLKFAQA